MTKEQIVAKIAKEAGISKKAAAASLNTFVGAVTTELKKGKRVPPGLAKKNKLPPGLAKRDRLPPGLQGRYLPDDLERRLRRLPDKYVRVKVGTDIVLMDRNTRVVFDIIYGVD